MESITIARTGACTVHGVQEDFAIFPRTSVGWAYDLGSLDATEFIAAGSTRKMNVTGLPYSTPAATNVWRP